MCGLRAFNRRRDMYNHIADNHPTAEQCGLCGEYFKNLVQLSTHIETEHDQNESETDDDESQNYTLWTQDDA